MSVATGVNDILSSLQAEKPEKKAAGKRYVSFSAEEWDGMEKTYGKKIDPADVKRIVEGIFKGVFLIGRSKAGAAADGGATAAKA